jgi:hypothetical protein
VNALWTPCPTIEDVAAAKQQGKVIEYRLYAENNWVLWNQQQWSANYEYRCRTAHPQMMTLTMRCYYDPVVERLVWSNANTISGDWVGVPSEDKVVEVLA